MSEGSRSHNATEIQVRIPELKISDDPVICPGCKQKLRSYCYLLVNGEQVLVDLDRNVIYEHEQVCRHCRRIFSFHAHRKAVLEHTEKLEKLIRSVEGMWARQDEGAEGGDTQHDSKAK